MDTNRYDHHVEGDKGGGANGQVQMRQKWARSAGLQGLRGTLGIRSRVARKRSAGTGDGFWRKCAMSRCKVDLIPEERGGLE